MMLIIIYSIPSGSKILAEETKLYQFTEEEVKEIARQLQELEEAKKEIEVLEQIIKGLEKEISIKDELIMRLEEKCFVLEEIIIRERKLSQTIEKANRETIKNLDLVIANKDIIIQEYRARTTLGITEKLKLVLAGVAIGAILEGIIN